MSEPTASDSYVLFALGAVQTAVIALVGYIFKSIRQSRLDAEKIAENVRAELLRADAKSVDAMQTMREEFNRRWNESRADRDVIRQENRQNHAENSERFERMLDRIANLPTRSDLLGWREARHDSGD